MSYCIFLSCHGHHNYCYFVPLYILVAAMVAQLEPLPMICGLFSHALPDLNGHPFPFRFSFRSVSVPSTQKTGCIMCHVTKNVEIMMEMHECIQCTCDFKSLL